ncbi:MAG: energy transducer TonB [Planctomycetota bacterium]
MLPPPIRLKSLFVSVLVHGTALSAALAVVATAPRRDAARALSLQVGMRDTSPQWMDAPAEALTPQIERPVEAELPPAFDVDEPLRDAALLEAAARFAESAAAAAAQAPDEALASLPTLVDGAAPFADLPRGLRLGARVPREPVVEEAAASATTAVERLPLDASADRPAPPPVPDEQPEAETPKAGAGWTPVPLAGARPTPDYPERWARRGWIGEVTIELEVAGDGTVIAARVVASSGFERLDELARATLARWRFEPAGGIATVGLFRQRVEFRPR